LAAKKKLIWQLYPSFLLITLISVVVVIWFASSALKDFYLEQTAKDLTSKTYLIENQVLQILLKKDLKSVDEFCKQAGLSSRIRITVILPSGKVAGDSDTDPTVMENHAGRPEFIEGLKGNSIISIRYSHTLKKKLMYAGIPIEANGNIIAVARTSISISSIDSELKEIQIKIVFGGMIIALFSAILCLIISKKISAPIASLKKIAEKMARGDFDFPFPISSTEEISGLSQTMKKMATDLSKRINTIVEQRNEIEAILGSMSEGLIAVDTEERILRMNSSAGRMIGNSPSQVQGIPIQEAVRNSQLQKFISEILAEKKHGQKEMELLSDSPVSIIITGELLEDAQEKQIGALFVLNNITTIRRLENIRQDFVANVSHELRTPITAIKGFVETIQAGKFENLDETGRFLDIIQKHTNRLEAIIEDLLNLSRLEKDSESSDSDMLMCGVIEILNRSIQACQPYASSRNIRIELDCNDSLEGYLDPSLMEHAVVNLINNAVKYSNEKSVIQVRASKTGKEIQISIEDHGCGIEKEHLPRLFERFYRVDKARSRQLGGTGLGLAIVKHIAQNHKGRVSVESTPGKGSIFSIYLPC